MGLLLALQIIVVVLGIVFTLGVSSLRKGLGSAQGSLSFDAMYAGPSPGTASISYSKTFLIFDIPNVTIPLILYLLNADRLGSTHATFVVFFCGHYLYRGYVYPFLISSRRRVPSSFAWFLFCFTSLTSFMQFRDLFVDNSGRYTDAWLRTPHFTFGAALFIMGMFINITSELHLQRQKRARPGKEWFVPRGYLYDWVLYPHYLGEIIEWAGWALLTWNTSTFIYAAFNCLTLTVQAFEKRKYLRDVEFAGVFPARVRAIFPYVL